MKTQQHEPKLLQTTVFIGFRDSLRLVSVENLTGQSRYLRLISPILKNHKIMSVVRQNPVIPIVHEDAVIDVERGAALVMRSL